MPATKERTKKAGPLRRLVKLVSPSAEPEPETPPTDSDVFTPPAAELLREAEGAAPAEGLRLAAADPEAVTAPEPPKRAPRKPAATRTAAKPAAAKKTVKKTVAATKSGPAKTSAARKTAAKKPIAKKSSAKTSPPNKTTAKKSPAKKSAKR